MMKKTSLLKSMLLLCALIVGSGSSWASEVTLQYTGSSTTNMTGNNDAATVGLSATDWSVVGDKGLNSNFPGLNKAGNIRLYWTDGGSNTITVSSLVGATINSITITYVSASNNNGTVTVGGSPASGSNSETTGSFTIGATSFVIGNGYSTNTQVQISSIVINYTPATPAYTITALSNNNELGTVSLSGSVITGSPKSGCRYASPAYTVTAGTATVSQNGNAFTVTPSTNCTITINFEEIPTHTASFYVNGTKVSEDADVEEDAAITFPSDPDDINGKAFMGWKKGSAIDGVTNEEPTLFTSDDMGNDDVSYYAVFAKVISNTPASWTETALGSMTASDIFVFSNGTYAIPNNEGTGSAPDATSITVSEDKITSAVADKLKWNVSGNASDGYTFYPNGSTTTWLYCTTTASSGTNDNIRVGTGSRKVWEFDGSGYLKTKDESTTRYLSLYSSQDFRSYVGTGNGAFVPKFYKYIPASKVVEGYCTTVLAEPSTPTGDVDVAITLTTTTNMAGWRTYNNNTSNKYTVDGTTKVYYASATGENKVTLTEIAGGVPANTVVILHQSSGTTITLTKDNDAVISGAPADPSDNELKVSTANENLGTVYRLGYKAAYGVGFYQYTSASAPAGVIYVLSVSSANFLDLDFGEGETTSVMQIETAKQNVGEVYDLQGRKVAQPTKGLYIVNGKKVVIK